MTDYLQFYNPKSLELVSDARMESSLLSAKSGMQFQFLRQGYFCVDKSSTSDRIVFNKTVGLKDSFSKEVKKS